VSCSVEGCDREAQQGRGWCRKHYFRWRNHGDPTVVIRPVSQVRLPAAPLIALVEAADGPVWSVLDGHGPLRRAFYRARQTGYVGDVQADRIAVRLGLTLDEVYGPAWDEVAA
jgi:hypothetical protein